MIKGVGWSIGNGKDVQVWKDNWIPSYSHFKQVNDFLKDDLSSWDPIKLSRYLAPIDIERIEHIKVGGPSTSDRICWMLNKKSVFSIRSVYCSQNLK